MSDSHQSVNLLFGILALQTDFISREQLVAAAKVWLLDMSRTLEEILVEHEALRDVAATDEHGQVAVLGPEPVLEHLTAFPRMHSRSGHLEAPVVMRDRVAGQETEWSLRVDLGVFAAVDQ